MKQIVMLSMLAISLIISAQSIEKKCKTCGKTLSSCSFHGRHEKQQVPNKEMRYSNPPKKNSTTKRNRNITTGNQAESRSQIDQQQVMVPNPTFRAELSLEDSIRNKRLGKSVFSVGSKLGKYKDESGLFGYINRKGDVVIQCQWKDAECFWEGYARVQNDDEKFGYIDTTGCVVIPCKWKYAYNFKEGMALVMNENKRHGYYDCTGTMVIPCQWTEAESFSEGLATVKDDGGRWGAINKKGDVIIPYAWKDLSPFREGLACISKEISREIVYEKRGTITKIKTRMGFIDKTGREVIPCIWKSAQPFYDGLSAVINEDSKHGYIDTNGNNVIPCKWKFARSFWNGNGMSEVEDDNGVWHVIDKTGKIVGE